MGKKILAVIVVILILAASYGGLISYKNNKILSSAKDFNKDTINKYFTKNQDGTFPKEMQGFLSEKDIDLSYYCCSYPNDLLDESKMIEHYKGVLLYKDVDLRKYKKELLPKLRVLIGKFSDPKYSYSEATKEVVSLPNPPNKKIFQNTLLEWCLIANRFEEKDDGNSAFILCYGAIRMSLHLLTDYSDGASLENLDIVNTIMNCACCQMIYIANSGLKHNSNMVRSIAKDLYSIAASYPALSRVMNYNICMLEKMTSDMAEKGNYVASYIKNSSVESSNLSSNLKKAFESLSDTCKEPFGNIYKTFYNYSEILMTNVKDAIGNFDLEKITESFAKVLIENTLFDFTNAKFDIDETKVIINGAATVLATYEYMDTRDGKFVFSPKIVSDYVKSKYPIDSLSGSPIYIEIGDGFNPFIIFTKGIKWMRCGRLKSFIVFTDTKTTTLRSKKREYKSAYFDEDEALRKMTPEEKKRYEEAKIEQEKREKEAQKQVEELLNKHKKQNVNVDSIKNIYCGYKLGTVAKNVSKDCYFESDLIKKCGFSVKAKEPFLGLFSVANIMVDGNTKKILLFDYSCGLDTTSERETALASVKNYLTNLTGANEKVINNTEEFYECEFFDRKENSVIVVSLTKGLDGGGTLSIYVSKNK